MIASGSRDYDVKVWSAESLALIETLTSQDWVFSVAWSPDSTKIVYAAYWDINIWDITLIGDFYMSDFNKWLCVSLLVAGSSLWVWVSVVLWKTRIRDKLSWREGL